MSLLKSAATVSVFTLLSRITGLIRDMLIARYFGVSAATDAFYVAFRIPNMLRRLFAEGAFSQAFVPMLSQVKEQQPEGEQKTFISDVFSLLGCAVFIASLLGIAFAPVVVWLIASGFKNNPETFDLAVFLTRCMFPYIIFMSLVSFAAAVLNTWKHFAVPAFTPVLLNVSFICCTLFLVNSFLFRFIRWHLLSFWAVFCSFPCSFLLLSESGASHDSPIPTRRLKTLTCAKF